MTRVRAGRPAAPVFVSIDTKPARRADRFATGVARPLPAWRWLVEMPIDAPVNPR